MLHFALGVYSVLHGSLCSASSDLAELLPPAWNPLKEALSLIQAVSVYVVNLEYEGCLMPVQVGCLSCLLSVTLCLVCDLFGGGENVWRFPPM